LCVERIDGTSVTLFSTGTSGVEDEITPEKLKRESDSSRYLEMADLAKHEKILKLMSAENKKTYPIKVL
jgi:hypothetical protein